MFLPLDIVKKYAPAVKFHENERVFPCSIEYLLEGATLNYRTWREAQKLDKQYARTPAAVFFKDCLYIIYTTIDDSEIVVSRYTDGPKSTDSLMLVDIRRIGQYTSVPAAAVFQDKIWIVYSEAETAQASYTLPQVWLIT
jgi:hypothetical protein